MGKTPYNCGEESFAIPILPLAVHLAFEMADYILKDDPSFYNDQLSYNELVKDRDRWLAKYQEQAERYQRLSDKYNKLLEEKLGLRGIDGE